MAALPPRPRTDALPPLSFEGCDPSIGVADRLDRLDAAIKSAADGPKASRRATLPDLLKCGGAKGAWS